MPGKKTYIKNTSRAQLPKLRLKPPRLRSQSSINRKVHPVLFEEPSHEALLSNIPPVEKKNEAGEAFNLEELTKVELTPSLSDKIEVKEILVETTINKEETPDSDQPLQYPKKEVKVPQARDFRKYSQAFNFRSYLTFILLLISVVSTISVTGLLQSTESVNSSGILVQTIPPIPPLNTPPPPPPEPEVEIDVYNDRECTEKIAEIKWGEIETGKSVNRIIYIKNAGDSEVTLSLVTENWKPTESSTHITLSWDYDGENLSSGAVTKITLTLKVEESVDTLGEFSFDIIIVGSAL